MSGSKSDRSTRGERVLEVRDLRKTFKVGRELLQAVDGVSFDLHAGETLGIVGESGCGKSTTARAIVGLDPASSGSVRYRGEELVGKSRRQFRPFRRKLQMIFQDPYASLDPRQNVEQIITEPMRIYRVGSRRQRRLHAMALLDAVGLNPRHVYRYPHEFSGGQRQRIGIARALALEPEVLVLDEPVSALDVSIQAQITKLLAELQERFDLAYLFIAHDLAVVRQLCDRIAVLYLGRVVELAERDALFSNPRHPYTRALLSAVPVPNPKRERSRQRILLEGDPPSPLDPPSGCRFHPRCAIRSRVPDQLCETLDPKGGLDRADAGESPRFVACHAEAAGISTAFETPEIPEAPESTATSFELDWDEIGED